MNSKKLFGLLSLVVLLLGMMIVPVAAQDEEAAEEEAAPFYGTPEGYEVSETDDTVTFTSGDNTIVVVNSATYDGIVTTSEFESDSEELVFVMDRLGYTTGLVQEALPENAVAGVGVSLSRRSQTGLGYLYDLGREKLVIVSLFTGRGQVGAPVADVEAVAAPFEYLGTIVDVAVDSAIGGNEDRAGLSLLVEAVQNADDVILETLSGEGNFTVFAPTNQAFINLSALLAENYDINNIFADQYQDVLTQVLLYHVVEGDVFAEDVLALTPGATVPTLLDTEQDAIVVDFFNDGSPSLNGGVGLVATDILASNGVIHVIDDVLLPQCVIDTLEGVGSCDPAPIQEEGEGDEG